MLNQGRKVLAEINEVRGVADLVKTYQQMAAQKMVDLQKQIASSKEYYKGLAVVSQEVGLDIDKVDREKQRAFLLLTADSRMYGDLLDRVFESFLKAIEKTPSALIYVYGKIGVQMMKVVLPDKKFVEVALSEVGELVETKKVEIFHSEYRNLAYQEVVSSSIEDLELSEDVKEEDEIKMQYFYEPSIAKVSNVFRNNITSGLVWFTISQSEMALSAARVIHLEKAISNTETSILKLRRALFSANRKVLQRKMMHQYQITKMKQ